MYLDKGASLVQNKGIYMFPRHLISYAMSDISAINIRLQYEADKDKGLVIYKKLCGLGGSILKPFSLMDYLQRQLF